MNSLVRLTHTFQRAKLVACKLFKYNLYTNNLNARNFISLSQKILPKRNPQLSIKLNWNSNALQFRNPRTGRNQQAAFFGMYLGASVYMTMNSSPTQVPPLADHSNHSAQQQHIYAQPHQNHMIGPFANAPTEFVPPDTGLSWNEFCYHMLARGEVERLIIAPYANQVTVVLHDGAIIKGRRQILKQRLMTVPDVDTFETKVRNFEQSLGIRPEDQVSIVYDRTTGNTGSMLFALAISGLFAYLMWRSMMGGAGSSTGGGASGPGGLLSQFGKAKFTLVDPLSRAANKATQVKFKDVAGLHEAKQEIMEFVEYLKKPEKFVRLGAKLPKGVLLLGPPGCGKTLLAKAVATEANVPFLALAGSDFVEMIGGVGAARVRDLFKQARKASPCIIYIDEIDALGRKRSDTGSGAGGSGGAGNTEGEQTLNQLLVEMDGMSSRQGVILLASTNRGDVLDQALLRPGRFDRHILIDLPNLLERRDIFLQHVSRVKLSENLKTKEKLDEYAMRMAQLTARMSGADIANVCNEAALHAARADKHEVSIADLEYAVERVVGGTEKRSAATSPEEKKIIAYHECGHALVGWLLEHTDAPLKVSIVPRTLNMLGFAQYMPSDQKLYTTEQIFDRMCMALGGRVAEMLVFNHYSTGAQDDLKKVTQMALAQIRYYGMDPIVGLLSFPPEDNDPTIPKWFKQEKPYSKRMAGLMEQRASDITMKAFKRTEQLLRDNMDKLKLLATTLLEKEVIDYSDIEKLIGPPNGSKKTITDFIDLPLPKSNKQHNIDEEDSNLTSSIGDKKDDIQNNDGHVKMNAFCTTSNNVN